MFNDASCHDDIYTGVRQWHFVKVRTEESKLRLRRWVEIDLIDPYCRLHKRNQALQRRTRLMSTSGVKKNRFGS